MPAFFFVRIPPAGDRVSRGAPWQQRDPCRPPAPSLPRTGRRVRGSAGARDGPRTARVAVEAEAGSDPRVFSCPDPARRRPGFRGTAMAAAQPMPPPSRIETEVRRARALVEKRQFTEALSLAQALHAEVPENRDVLYLVAVSQRYLGRIADALRTLARFAAVHPDYGRLFQEIGHCYRTVGEADAAIEAYQQAVARNHPLSASWRALRDPDPAPR